MPNRATRRAQPEQPIAPQADVQVDVNRVLTIYSDRLAQATQAQIIAEATRDQVMEENGSLRARIAELESNIENAALDADEADNQ